MFRRWTVWKLAISAFVLFHVTATLVWVLPDSAVKAALFPKFRPYMIPLGLWQRWALFAPNPVRSTFTLEAEVSDANGLGYVHEFAKIADLPWPEKTIKFRHSKFAANLAIAEYEPQRVMVARHAVRALKIPAESFPVYVRLYYQVALAPPPGSSAADPMEPKTIENLAAFRFDSRDEVYRR